MKAKYTTEDFEKEFKPLQTQMNALIKKVAANLDKNACDVKYWRSYVKGIGFYSFGKFCEDLKQTAWNCLPLKK